MSQGNMMLGYARGKMGSLVFSRSGGKQITRAYNSRPADLRSRSQIFQRSKFAFLQKFFTHGEQNLFKFAFEYKRPGESDFNAFMRYNSQIGKAISKEGFQVEGYPSIAKFCISRGSLTPPDIAGSSGNEKFILSANGLTADSQWKDVSESLIEMYNLRNNDVVTILYLHAADTYMGRYPLIFPFESDPTRWTIWQGRINTTSSKTVAQVLGSRFFCDVNGLNLSDENGEVEVNGFAVIFSRDTRRGLKTSTSFVRLNGNASEAAAGLNDEEYIEAALRTWGYNDDATLKGASSKS